MSTELNFCIIAQTIEEADAARDREKRRRVLQMYTKVLILAFGFHIHGSKRFPAAIGNRMLSSVSLTTIPTWTRPKK